MFTVQHLKMGIEVIIILYFYWKESKLHLSLEEISSFSMHQHSVGTRILGADGCWRKNQGRCGREKQIFSESDVIVLQKYYL